MRTYEERADGVQNKITVKRRQKRLIRGAVTVACVVALALVLFLPFHTDPPSVRQYRSSPYYDLIQKINEATYERPAYKNNFQKLLSAALRGGLKGEIAPNAPGEDGVMGAPNYGGADGENGAYQEVTDNQVAGVIEGDLIKRTDKYIFYLHSDGLGVYTIEGEQSKPAGFYSLLDHNGTTEFYYGEREMFLSQDGKTVTLILPGFGDALTEGKKEAYVCLLSLDVSDPESIRESGRIYLTGSYLSSRLVDGNLLLISQYQIDRSFRFDQPETFLPRVGVPGTMQCIAAEDIVAPEELNNTRYTVMTMLDQKELTAKDAAAFLSYSQELYVSKENIFATRSFNQFTGKGVFDGDVWAEQTMTQITCMGYDANGFIQKGGITVAGSVKNQYSMDEHEGILRVVASTRKRVNRYRVDGDLSWGESVENVRNVNLYCISMADWSIAACVESFAPEGETAESVRFDGKTAYVCTAEVITLTDPVYRFDLSDLSNITWKDTGIIDGYSSSLVNFGDYLLGIGYNGNRELKIEIYQETQTGVESVAAYERSCGFSEEYKSYFIDRENQMIGLGISDYGENGGKYILLQFDGYQLRTLIEAPLNGPNQWKRGVVIDGWLYLFSNREEFRFLDIAKWQYQYRLYEKVWGSQEG